MHSERQEYRRVGRLIGNDETSDPNRPYEHRRGNGSGHAGGAAPVGTFAAEVGASVGGEGEREQDSGALGAGASHMSTPRSCGATRRRRGARGECECPVPTPAALWLRGSASTYRRGRGCQLIRDV
jgi:hypothetical protein